MKDFALLVGTILIWAVIWRYLAKFWRAKGHGRFVSHLGASGVGFIVSMFFLLALIPKKEPAVAVAASRSTAPSPALADRPAASDSSTNEQASQRAEITTAASTSENNGDEENDASDVGDLGVTPDQYAARFDKLVKEMDLPFRARFSKKLTGSTVDSVRADFDEHMGLIGRVSKKSGKLLEVTLIGGSDGTADTAANIVLVAAAALTAAIPEASIKSVSPKIVDMVAKYKEGEDSQERVLNGVRLYYMRGDHIGHWFGAKPS